MTLTPQGREDKMKDNEARGLILTRLYEIRNEVDYANPKDLAGLPLAETVIGNILQQLGEKGLIDWKPVRAGPGRNYLAYMAHISAFGVDVVEGKSQPPISITIDSSVNVHGSQNVLIGGQGNVQTVTMDIEKMISVVDSSGTSVREREEAKSLLKKIAENKLVQTVLTSWFKSKFGTG
jgi:hypothetical protein